MNNNMSEQTTSQQQEIQRYNVLGVGISAINIPIALDLLSHWIEQRQQVYVCVRDVHGVMLCQRDPHLRQIHDNADLVTPDGMPIVWMSRFHGLNWVDRVYGPDLMRLFTHYSVQRGYRHYFYGGNPGVPEELAERLQRQSPGLQIAGLYSPPFRPLTPVEDEAIVQAINAACPDIVWVGLSTPKQELWIWEHRERLEAPILIGVGAAFDFLSGRKRQAPYWMQRRGLEWVFRLVTEPRRLWKRYLINNPLFIVLVIQQILGHRYYQVERWKQGAQTNR